jgi:hydroxyquinol 1,2-dioxygenase
VSDFDEQLITPAVLNSFSGTPDPRLRKLVESLTRHLHAFVRETRLTQNEWAKGVEYLTAVGQKCDDVRQEFILLSDVLGVSMLVDAVNHDMGSAERTRRCSVRSLSKTHRRSSKAQT